MMEMRKDSACCGWQILYLNFRVLLWHTCGFILKVLYTKMVYKLVGLCRMLSYSSVLKTGQWPVRQPTGGLSGPVARFEPFI